MAEPTLVLLVLLAGPRGGESMDDATVGTAVREALGGETRVLVDPGRTPFTDDDTTATAARIHADAVATVAWSDADRTSARIHMYVTADGRFYDRELTFQSADDQRERERAVGFLVGAMVRAAQAEQAAPAPSAEPEPAVVSLPPPVVAHDARVTAPSAPVAPQPRRHAFAVEAAAIGTAGIGGAALGAGPQLAIAWYPWARVAIRAGGSVVFGTVSDAQATTMGTRITGGMSFRPWSFGPADRGTLELGVALVAVDHRVQRDDPPATRDRWIGGGQLTARVGWRASDPFEPFAWVAGELVAGNTPLVVASHTTAQIPPGRVLAGLGLALKF